MRKLKGKVLGALLHVYIYMLASRSLRDLSRYGGEPLDMVANHSRYGRELLDPIGSTCTMYMYMYTAAYSACACTRTVRTCTRVLLDVATKPD